MTEDSMSLGKGPDLHKSLEEELDQECRGFDRDPDSGQNPAREYHQTPDREQVLDPI